MTHIPYSNFLSSSTLKNKPLLNQFTIYDRWKILKREKNLPCNSETLGYLVNNYFKHIEMSIILRILTNSSTNTLTHTYTHTQRERSSPKALHDSSLIPELIFQNFLFQNFPICISSIKKVSWNIKIILPESGRMDQDLNMVIGSWYQMNELKQNDYKMFN